MWYYAEWYSCPWLISAYYCSHNQSVSMFDWTVTIHDPTLSHTIYKTRDIASTYPSSWCLMDLRGSQSHLNQWSFWCTWVSTEERDGTKSFIRYYLNRCKNKQTDISSHNKACKLLNRVLLTRCCKVLLNFQLNICCLIVHLCLGQSWLWWQVWDT